MRTFDADALMLHMDASKYVRNNTTYAHGWNDALEYYINYIAEHRTIEAVPVVRCKDCKYWEYGDCYRLELSRPNDFCSYGERRKDETD